ncbi:MAG: hypothetical protein IJS53_05150 [Clostridia bacterium]|nr:hypothetical protein [Clostridia bacterium]
MQTPENPQNNPYEQQGFTAVPAGPVPQAPEAAYYGAQAPHTPVQQQVPEGMPPAYSPAAQYAPQGQAPYQQAAYQQAPYAPNPYQQSAYPAQQPDPFPQQPPHYRAPRQRNYSKLNIALGMVVVAMLVILGAIAISQFAGRKQTNTARVTASSASSTHAGDALIVRSEVVYTQEGVSQIEYEATEGATVRRGDKVCIVYTAGFNSREWTTLNTYRTQIKEYQKVLLADTNIENDAQLKRYNSAVLSRAQETQDMVQSGAGNLLNQETMLKSDISERSYYLRQKYADDQRLSRLYDDESTQLRRIETWTKPFAAGDAGVVSFYTDGYERVLNMLTYGDFSPAEVRQMIRGVLPDSAALGRNEVAVYRIVRTGSYAVLLLSKDTNWSPVVGDTYELMIESFDNTRVSATVESVTRSEGELLIRLTVRADVTPVLYIRSCHVQLSENVYSLTVPVNALTSDSGEIGVVVVQPDGNYFLPVSVLSQDAHEARIVPLLNNILVEGSTVLLF